MTVQTQPDVLQNRFFRYDLRQELPVAGKELQQFSSTDMNDGTEQDMLDRYGFKPMPVAGPGPLQYYVSDFAQDAYMGIAHVDGYRLIIFIHDEASLLAFRRKNDFSGSMLVRMLMPPQPPAPDNVEIIKMNVRALR